MPPKKQIEVVFPITSQQQFLDITSESNKKVSIIDVHLEWCGSCTVIKPNFTSMYFMLDNAANRIEFWTACEDIIPEEIKATFKKPLDTEPKFLIFHQGVQTAEIDGAHITQIEAKAMEAMPSLDD